MVKTAAKKREANALDGTTSFVAKPAGTKGPKVFLIGMMGTGKTYWAERLKQRLKLPAYDLDTLVEMMEEKSINEIFAAEGEEFFRKEEAKMLRLFKEKTKFILSCGGGSPCFNNNMEWMNNQGLTIWIDESVEVLTQRLAAQKDHRPLIKNLKEEELNSYLKEKLAQRRQYYSQAHYTLAGTQITEENLLKIIRQHA